MATPRWAQNGIFVAALALLALLVYAAFQPWATTQTLLTILVLFFLALACYRVIAQENK